ncbi:hypothetical protein HY498_00220 [Candidatus Woesearchaeota archaeon]|nr:hypothetical protein [Candidatus Woesearchaeota archaeon]
MFQFLKKKEVKPQFPGFPSLEQKDGPKFPEQEAIEFPKFPEPKGTFLEKHEEIPTYKPTFPTTELPKREEPLKLQFPEQKPPITAKEELEIPIRKPTFRPTLSPQALRIERYEEPQREPIREYKFEPTRIPEVKEYREPIVHKEESIFVKVEKYEEARNLLSKVTEKLNETQKLISELERIKDEEESQLKSYQESVNSIKQKLVDIDKTLFSE